MPWQVDSAISPGGDPVNIRQPENPFPPDEPCPGYFAPPPDFVVGQEWRLIQTLRDVAQSKNATSILIEAAMAQCQQLVTPSAPNLGMAFAELAVTGQAAFADFASTLPQDFGPVFLAAQARLAALGGPFPLAQQLPMAMQAVLDRAYQVAWYLRAQTSRGDLKWIAVSGEDDLPHRPVNVPGTMFPQCDLSFTVPGDMGAIPVRTRYAIATATSPVPTPVALAQRSLPAAFQPALPPNDRIILFIHGSDSRLEEANDLIPKLVRLPDGGPSGFSVISMDLPGSGYGNQLDHKAVGPWTALTLPAVWPIPAVGIGSVTSSLLPFLENFIVNFVGALSMQMGQPGLVESRLAAVMGGSLGGNLALRLARRPEAWLRKAVAFSPGSVWNAKGLDPSAAMLQAAVKLAIPSVGLPEDPTSRDQFFAAAFDQKIPDKTQPDQWYRDDWPSKMQYITNARLDRREIYTPQYRSWHWRVSIEELLWSWQVPAVQNFQSHVLLGAGSDDDILPARIFTNTQGLAGQLGGTKGDTFFFDNTGHSIHAERPDALARKIVAFLADGLEGSWLNMSKPPGANIKGLVGAVTVMDTPTSPQRPYLFVECSDGNLWCRSSTGSAWNWDNMGKPLGANIRGLLGAVTVMDTPTSPRRPHAFVEGDDYNLWCFYWSGSAWSWLNMSKPPGANILGLVGAVTVMDTPTSPQRPHLFVSCSDGNLWCRSSTGSTWNWDNLGKPPVANIRGLLGAVTVMDTPTSAQRAHAFVEGDDYNLWCLYWSGSVWSWLNMSKPPGANIKSSVGAVSVMDTPISPQRPHLFVACSDGNLWCRWSTGSDWSWLNMGKPPVANINGPVGSVTVMDTTTSPQRPQVFVEGDDHNLWCRSSSGSAWSWLNVGKPQGANPRGLLGAVTVMDTNTSPQRPHVFVEGDDYNLWCLWWG
jgi:pimeloyl-ACP methyl ester carboxylesterase